MQAHRRTPSPILFIVAAELAIMSLAAFPRTAACRTWRVPGDAPTIQAGVDLAASGDDVLVAPGTYSEHDIAMKGGITVHSEAGPGSTTIQAGDAGAGFSCEALTEASTIEGFSITHGRVDTGEEWHSSGGGIRCLNSSLEIRDCVINDCYAGFVGGGIMAMESDVSIERCTVSNCEAYGVGGICGWGSTIRISDCVIADNEASSVGGIHAFGPEVTIIGCVVKGNHASWGSTGGISCASLRLTIRDCLITDNYEVVMGGPSAVDVWDSAGTISGCTVSYNDGWNQGDAAVSVTGSDIRIERTIIAFNSCAALACSYDAEVNVACCDLFGNRYGDNLCGDDLGGNFSADPLFCDASSGDFALDGQSPCLPGQHPDGDNCGLIGARGRGCGTPPTGACCFVDGSCLVLGKQECGDGHGTYQGDGTTCDPNPCEATPIRPTTWGQIRASYR